MLQYTTDRAISAENVECNNVQFSDVAKDVKKQCFCERDVPLPPFVQAKEGDRTKHFCSGNVFYVRQRDNTGKKVLLKEALTLSYHTFEAKFAKDGYHCNNNFLKKDPAPGHPKQCYCDNDGQISEKQLQLHNEQVKQDKMVESQKKQLKQQEFNIQTIEQTAQMEKTMAEHRLTLVENEY